MRKYRCDRLRILILFAILLSVLVSVNYKIFASDSIWSWQYYIHITK